MEAGALRASVRVLPLIRGEVQIGEFELADAVLRLVTDGQGRSSLEGLMPDDAPAEESPAPGEGFSSGPISLSSVTVEIRDERTGRSDSFHIDSLELDRFAFGEDLQLRYLGRLGDPEVLESVSLDGTLFVPADSGQPVRFDAFESSSRLAGTRIEIGARGDLVVDRADPLGVELMDGRVDIDGQPLRISANYSGSQPPLASLEVAGELLDLDAILESLPEAAGNGEDEAESHPLVFLRDLDVDASLDLDVLRVAGLELQDVQTVLKVRDGVARLGPLGAGLDAGRVDAEVEIDLRRDVPELRLKPIFELSDAGALLSRWGLDTLVEGGGRLELDLTGEGLEISQLLQSLSGTGLLELSEGRLHGFDLQAMVAGIESGQAGQAIAGAVGGTTRFDRLESPLEIAEGVLGITALDLSFGGYSLSGPVAISLADLGLEGQLRFEQERLSRLPVELSGSLRRPEVRLAAEEAVREEVETRLLDALQRRFRSRDEDDGESGDESGS